MDQVFLWDLKLQQINDFQSWVGTIVRETCIQSTEFDAGYVISFIFILKYYLWWFLLKFSDDVQNKLRADRKHRTNLLQFVLSKCVAIETQRKILRVTLYFRQRHDVKLSTLVVHFYSHIEARHRSCKTNALEQNVPKWTHIKKWSFYKCRINSFIDSVGVVKQGMTALCSEVSSCPLVLLYGVYIANKLVLRGNKFNGKHITRSVAHWSKPFLKITTSPLVELSRICRILPNNALFERHVYHLEELWKIQM